MFLAGEGLLHLFGHDYHLLDHRGANHRGPPRPFLASGVWGSNHSDVYFVGRGAQGAAIIAHRKGSVMRLPVSTHQLPALHAVWGSDGVFFAVGELGVILRHSSLTID